MINTILKLITAALSIGFFPFLGYMVYLTIVSEGLGWVAFAILSPAFLAASVAGGVLLFTVLLDS